MSLGTKLLLAAANGAFMGIATAGITRLITGPKKTTTSKKEKTDVRD